MTSRRSASTDKLELAFPCKQWVPFEVNHNRSCFRNKKPEPKTFRKIDTKTNSTRQLADEEAISLSTIFIHA